MLFLRQMLKIIRNQFSGPTEKSGLWLIQAFIFRGLTFIFLLSKPGEHSLPGFLGFLGGDSHSYLEPLENLVDKGNYQPDFRMPGFALFYLPFYYLFGKIAALNILIFIQYIFASISVYLLALSANMLFKSKIYFYFTFYVFAISTYSNLFDSIILSESLATSFFIFGLYYFLKWQKNRMFLTLVFSGLCLTQLIFLRAVFAPVLVFFLILILAEREQLQKRIYNGLIFLLPFVLLDGLWIIRNYPSHHKFVPLTVSSSYPGTEKTLLYPLCEFMHTFGGNTVFWDAGAEIRWFGYGKNTGSFGKGVDPQGKLPDYLSTSVFNKDSLQIIKQKCEAYLYDSTLTKQVKEAHKSYIFNKLNIYTASVKSERKWLYYVIAPLKRLKLFLFHSGTYNLFGKSVAELNLIEFGIKIFYSLFYVGGLILGFSGIILALVKKAKSGISYLLPIIIGYTIVIHPFVVRLFEARYFVPVWPFLLLYTNYAVVWILSRLKVLNRR
jgi:hypothetical protein